MTANNIYKAIVLTILILVTKIGVSQTGYWQQKIKYEMDIDMNVDTYKYTGNTKIIYYNNSPDTISKVYFHLYFNAFQPGSEMDIRQQNLPDPDSRIGNRISKLSPTEIGYQKIDFIKQGKSTLPYKIEGTIMEVTLKKILLPNSKTTFYLKNEAQIPVQIRRSGRNNAEGVKLSMTQWYPKMAEYDKSGWNLDPYIAREFYGVYGVFDVKININRDYTIGGTGILTNPQEIGHGYNSKGKKLKVAKTKKLQWHFYAENVHDFAWGADNEYLHDIVKMNDNTDIHFLYKGGSKERTEIWKELEEKMQKAFYIINKNFGEYPYKQFSIVQGGDGGMEYPMSTLILGDGKSIEGIVGLTVHESLHSWYYGVLGFNEQKYSWMDEGFTTWAESLTMSYLFDKGNNGDNPHRMSYRRYYALQKSGKEQALSTKADFYNTNYAYGLASYSKGSVFLSQLGYIIGDDNLHKTMLRLFHDWKFKHPSPNDLKLIAEDISGIKLQWYFDKWINTTQNIDYKITSVIGKENNTEITLSRVGDIPMPMDISIILKNGEVKTYYIPLRMMHGDKENETEYNRTILKSWPWVYPEYSFDIDISKSEIKHVVIDISDRMADTDKSNNYYPENKYIFKGGL